MKLDQTRRHWEEFARQDPLWAILTEPGKEGNRWNEAEFFASGRAAVEADLAYVRRHIPSLATGRALDFGCGVGRLTQALADHFKHVTGLDIAAPMLEHARRFNRHGERVEYVLNTRDDLSVFPTGHFDFVYSLITLQHVAPAYTRRYLQEMVRVAAGGGVILFQLPAWVDAPARPFTLWPDTLVRRLARDLRRRFRRGPVMEMHAIDPQEVGRLLAEAGAEVVRVEAHQTTTTQLDSRLYLARKR